VDGKDQAELAAGQAAQTVAQSTLGVQKARQAKELLRQGQWPAALAIYHELVEAFPYDRELRRHVLLSAFKWKDYREVLQQTLDLAEIAFAEGDSHSGLERYSEVLRLPELVAGDQGVEVAAQVAEMVEPLKADIYFVFGDHYMAENQPDLALQYFDVSERLLPGRWETHWGRGQALLLKGDKKEAVRSLYQSIQLAPNEAASAYELLGEVLLGEGRELRDLRKYFVRASGIFEAYECFDDALRVSFRWLQLDPQDREMADRARLLTQLIHSAG
jgi:tetratricopeptide (TPR) repeat protein